MRAFEWTTPLVECSLAVSQTFNLDIYSLNGNVDMCSQLLCSQRYQFRGVTVEIFKIIPMKM